MDDSTHPPSTIHRRIRVLPDHLANKIAAGEVIQRPESVVKELLENALDAGATEILVVIRDGGAKLIQIADDGTGMDEGDAVTSFLRHATSKISTYEDLEGVSTYGFRGEALASVAAVAQVTMTTRRPVDDAAVVVKMDGSGDQKISREARHPGTTVTVQNLFFNVPARRKFLKSTNTEFRHVYDAVQRVAISHPEVSLKFISDDDIILDLRPAALEDRLRDLFGERQLGNMVWTEERSEFVSVSGYIGKPQFGQKSRVNQYLFLNRRFITNRNINHAVFSAYENLLVRGTFPFFLLFIEIDPHRVDVNVHPSKMEAKFEDEQGLYRFISSLVRKTLAANNLVPALSLTETGLTAADIGLQFTARQHAPFGPGPDHAVAPPGSIRLFTDAGKPVTDGEALAETLLRPPSGDAVGVPGPAPAETGVPEEGLVWQVHNKYILLQIENGLMVVDQHVAHERVLYERALGRFEAGLPLSQQILFPLTVQLSPADYAIVEELLQHLSLLGFSLKLFGKNTVLIEGVPPDSRTGSEVRLLQEVIGLYKEYEKTSRSATRENLAKSYSCKAAVKAGDQLSEKEMRELIRQLFATKMPYVCPHGRPVVLKISVAELDRRFGRK